VTVDEHPHLLVKPDANRFEVGNLCEMLLLKKTSALLLLLLESDGVGLEDVDGVGGVGERGVDEAAVETFLRIVDGGDEGRVGVRLVRLTRLGTRVRVSLDSAVLASLESGGTTARDVAFFSLTRRRRRCNLDVLPPVNDATARSRLAAVPEGELLESLVEVVLNSRKATTTVDLEAVLHRRLPSCVHLPTKLDRDRRTLAGEDGSGRGRRRSRLTKTTRKSRNGDDDYLLVLDGFDTFRVLASLYDRLGNAAGALRSVHGARKEKEGNFGKVMRRKWREEEAAFIPFSAYKSASEVR
jgi:hypothetical protein